MMKINDRVLILNQRYLNQTGIIITLPMKENSPLVIVKVDGSGRAVLFDKTELFKLEQAS